MLLVERKACIANCTRFYYKITHVETHLIINSALIKTGNNEKHNFVRVFSIECNSFQVGAATLELIKFQIMWIFFLFLLRVEATSRKCFKK